MATFFEVEELEETECSGTSEDFSMFGDVVGSSESSEDPPVSSYPPSSLDDALTHAPTRREWNPRPR
jgi:hypothetical protein